MGLSTVPGDAWRLVELWPSGCGGVASCVITGSASGVAAKVAASGTVARGICCGVAGCSVAGTCGFSPNWKGMPGVCSGCPVPVPVGAAVWGCPGVVGANTGDFSGVGLAPYLGCTAFLALEVACLVGGGRSRRSSRFCTTIISVLAIDPTWKVNRALPAFGAEIRKSICRPL